MSDEETLILLEDLAQRLGMEIRRCPGEFTGGRCRIRGRQVFVLNASLPVRTAVELLCRELSCCDLDSCYVLPALRRRIEGYGNEREALLNA